MNVEHHLAELHAAQQCIRCNRSYRELDNLGQWQCSFHPGHVQYDAGVHILPDSYTCCNTPAPGSYDRHLHTRPPLRRGCTPADHVGALHAFVPDVAVYDADDARVLFSDAFFSGPGVVYDQVAHQYLIIRRADHSH